MVRPGVTRLKTSRLSGEQIVQIVDEADRSDRVAERDFGKCGPVLVCIALIEALSLEIGTRRRTSSPRPALPPTPPLGRSKCLSVMLIMA